MGAFLLRAHGENCVLLRVRSALFFAAGARGRVLCFAVAARTPLFCGASALLFVIVGSGRPSGVGFLLRVQGGATFWHPQQKTLRKKALRNHSKPVHARQKQVRPDPRQKQNASYSGKKK